MKSFVRNIALAVAVATGTATLVTLTPAMAQTVKEKAKETPKGKEATKDVKGTVTLKKDKSGEFRFYIKNDAGKVIAMSVVGYEKEDEATAVLNEVKALLNSQKPTLEK